MTITFHKDFPSRQTFSRADVITIDQLARHSVAAECACSPDDIPGSITLFIGTQILRFDSVDELTENFPPLNPICGFQINRFINPFNIYPNDPHASLCISKDCNGAEVRVNSSARSEVKAQEIVSRIIEPLSVLCQPVQQEEHNSVRKEPHKFSPKSLLSIFRVFGSVTGTAADLPEAANMAKKIIRAVAAFFKQF